MGKKNNNMSFPCSPTFQEKLKDYAKTKGTTTAKLLRNLVDKYLNFDEDVIPVIIKVPKKMLDDQMYLEAWLQSKVDAIANALQKKGENMANYIWKLNFDDKSVPCNVVNRPSIHIQEIEQPDGSFLPGDARWLPCKVCANEHWSGKQDVSLSLFNSSNAELERWHLQNAEVEVFDNSNFNILFDNVKYDNFVDCKV